MRVRHHTVATVDVELGPGRETLRLTLSRREDGEEAELVLALGFGGGDSGEPWVVPPWPDAPLRLPADAIADLVDALDALEGEGP